MYDTHPTFLTMPSKKPKILSGISYPFASFQPSKAKNINSSTTLSSLYSYILPLLKYRKVGYPFKFSKSQFLF